MAKRFVYEHVKGSSGSLAFKHRSTRKTKRWMERKYKKDANLFSNLPNEAHRLANEAIKARVCVDYEIALACAYEVAGKGRMAVKINR